MGKGIVSDAQLRLLRTINYTGLQIPAIAFLNAVMIGKWKRKKERKRNRSLRSLVLHCFRLKGNFSPERESLKCLAAVAERLSLIKPSRDEQASKNKTGSTRNCRNARKERKTKWNNNKGMYLSPGRASSQHLSSCTALPLSANSFLCLTFSSPPLTPGAASFVIRQVMRAMLLTLTSPLPLMRYNLCCFMFAEPRAKARVRQYRKSSFQRARAFL